MRDTRHARKTLKLLPIIQIYWRVRTHKVQFSRGKRNVLWVLFKDVVSLTLRKLEGESSAPHSPSLRIFYISAPSSSELAPKRVRAVITTLVSPWLWKTYQHFLSLTPNQAEGTRSTSYGRLFVHPPAYSCCPAPLQGNNWGQEKGEKKLLLCFATLACLCS